MPGRLLGTMTNRNLQEPSAVAAENEAARLRDGSAAGGHVPRPEGAHARAPRGDGSQGAELG